MVNVKALRIEYYHDQETDKIDLPLMDGLEFFEVDNVGELVQVINHVSYLRDLKTIESMISKWEHGSLKGTAQEDVVFIDGRTEYNYRLHRIKNFKLKSFDHKLFLKDASALDGLSKEEYDKIEETFYYRHREQEYCDHIDRYIQKYPELAATYQNYDNVEETLEYTKNYVRQLGYEVEDDIKEQIETIEKNHNLHLTYTNGRIIDVKLVALEKESDKTTVCDETRLPIFEEDAVKAGIYSNAFDENPELYSFASNYFYECSLGEHYSTDSGAWYCSGCDRYISEHEGYTSNFRSPSEDEDYCEHECTRCAHDRALSGEYNKPSTFGTECTHKEDKCDCVEINGQKWEPRKTCKLPVNFSRRGLADYEVSEDWMFLSSHNMPRFNRWALEMTRDGYQVIVSLDRMSLLGDEAYVDVYYKKEENNVHV